MDTPLTTGDVWLLEHLKRYPQLRERVERLVQAVEDTQGDLRKADEAEGRVIEEVRRLGQEVLTAWAEG